MNIGLIGLDTSHVIAFTKLLHETENPYHVPGGRVVVGYSGGSPDFALSYGRVEKFTNDLRDVHGVKIVDSPEAVAENCDVILLTSGDGRVHLEQFRKVVNYRKPVFIDKPLATTLNDAQAIVELSESYGVPVMSCSSLRYAEALHRALATEDVGELVGIDAYGPLAIEHPIPGIFWYGVHIMEMLVTALGSDAKVVSGRHLELYDSLTIEWQSGKIGTFRGNRTGNNAFGGTVHFEKKSVPFQVSSEDKPFYASLLENVMAFFKVGTVTAPTDEALAIVRLMEEGNKALGYSH